MRRADQAIGGTAEVVRGIRWAGGGWSVGAVGRADWEIGGTRAGGRELRSAGGNARG